jgi:hypothetical protein
MSHDSEIEIDILLGANEILGTKHRLMTYH